MYSVKFDVLRCMTVNYEIYLLLYLFSSPLYFIDFYVRYNLRFLTVFEVYIWKLYLLKQNYGFPNWNFCTILLVVEL